MRQDRAVVIEWLLEGDPSIRWQVLHDLEGAAEPIWTAEQDRVSTEGWEPAYSSIRMTKEDGHPGCRARSGSRPLTPW